MNWTPYAINSRKLFVNNFKKYIQLPYYTFIREHSTKFLFVKLFLIYLNQNFLTSSIDTTPTPTYIHRQMSHLLHLLIFLFSFCRVDWIQFWQYAASTNTMYSYFTIALPKSVSNFSWRNEFWWNANSYILRQLSIDMCRMPVGVTDFIMHRCTVGCLTLNRSKNDRHQRNNRWRRRKIKIH